VPAAQSPSTAALTARASAAAPLNWKFRHRLTLHRQCLCHAPEQARELAEGNCFQAARACIRRDGKQLKPHDGARIDLFDHDMGCRAEYRRAFVDCEMTGDPAGILRRSGMEIIGAEAEGIENSRRHDNA